MKWPKLLKKIKIWTIPLLFYFYLFFFWGWIKFSKERKKIIFINSIFLLLLLPLLLPLFASIAVVRCCRLPMPLSLLRSRCCVAASPFPLDCPQSSPLLTSSLAQPVLTYWPFANLRLATAYAIINLLAAWLHGLAVIHFIQAQVLQAVTGHSRVVTFRLMLACCAAIGIPSYSLGICC